MPINRAPFTALIDDDGSGNTGSVWNKAAIQNVLLDPIDGQLPVLTPVPFDAANFRGVSAGLVWTVSAGAVIFNEYSMVGNKWMLWSLYIAWFGGGSTISGTPGASIAMKLPGGRVGGGNGQYLALDYTPVAGTPSVAGLYGTVVSNEISISKSTGGAWGVGEAPGFIASLLIFVV